MAFCLSRDKNGLGSWWGEQARAVMQKRLPCDLCVEYSGVGCEGSCRLARQVLVSAHQAGSNVIDSRMAAEARKQSQGARDEVVT